MVGGMCGRGCVGQAGMCGRGRGHAWQRAMHGRGACVAGGMHDRRDGHCSRWYASYWNAFLFYLCNEVDIVNQPVMLHDNIHISFVVTFKST